MRRIRGRFATHVELCDSFARRNYNRSQAQQIAAIDATVAGARSAGAEKASVSIGNPFGSNFEGPFSLQQRLALLDLMIGKWQTAEIPVTRVSLLEAMGWNLPHLVRETILAIKDRWPTITDFHLHLHNQRGATIGSYYEGLLLGVREFDTSLAVRGDTGRSVALPERAAGLCRSDFSVERERCVVAGVRPAAVFERIVTPTKHTVTR